MLIHGHTTDPLSHERVHVAQGADASGNALAICCASQAALEFAISLRCTTRLRSCEIESAEPSTWMTRARSLMHTERRELLFCCTADLRIRYETRPREYEGPQRACHLDELEVCVLESGVEVAQVGNVRLRQTSGQIGLIPPGVEHSSWTGSKAVAECIVHVKRRRLEDVADSLGMKEMPAWEVEPTPLSAEWSALLQQLKTEAAHAGELGHDLAMETLAIGVALRLLRTHAGNPKLRICLDPATQSLKRVEELMRAAPEEAHSLDDLARVAGMTKFHFLRSFRARFGLPPHAYLLGLRVQRAAEQIRSSDRSLTSIALELGFGSSSRLTEAFRKAHGTTPSAWRARPEQFSESRRAIVR